MLVMTFLMLVMVFVGSDYSSHVFRVFIFFYRVIKLSQFLSYVFWFVYLISICMMSLKQLLLIVISICPTTLSSISIMDIFWPADLYLYDFRVSHCT